MSIERLRILVFTKLFTLSNLTTPSQRDLSTHAGIKNNTRIYIKHPRKYWYLLLSLSFFRLYTLKITFTTINTQNQQTQAYYTDNQAYSTYSQSTNYSRCNYLIINKMKNSQNSIFQTADNQAIRGGIGKTFSRKIWLQRPLIPKFAVIKEQQQPIMVIGDDILKTDIFAPMYFSN